MDVYETFAYRSRRAFGVIAISSATSSSVGVRPRRSCSVECAFSIARILSRMERGTQSCDRSASIIAPLMRGTA